MFKVSEFVLYVENFLPGLGKTLLISARLQVKTNRGDYYLEPGFAGPSTTHPQCETSQPATTKNTEN